MSFGENKFQGLSGPFGPNPLKGYISRLQPDVRAVKNCRGPGNAPTTNMVARFLLKPDLLDQKLLLPSSSSTALLNQPLYLPDLLDDGSFEIGPYENMKRLLERNICFDFY